MNQLIVKVFRYIKAESRVPNQAPVRANNINRNMVVLRQLANKKMAKRKTADIWSMRNITLLASKVKKITISEKRQKRKKMEVAHYFLPKWRDIARPWPPKWDSICSICSPYTGLIYYWNYVFMSDYILWSSVSSFMLMFFIKVIWPWIIYSYMVILDLWFVHPY